MSDKGNTDKYGILPVIKECVASFAPHTRLPREFLLGLTESDDWSLIIKLHALVESSLNSLITHAIGDGRVLEIVMRLDTSDKQRGKMAFIKALELLPSEARIFVSKLSELRNDLVHDVSNFNFSLSKWVKEMAPQDLSNFTKSLNFDGDGRCEYWYSKRKDNFRNLPNSDLKAILIFACLSLLNAAINQEFEKFKQPLIQEEKRLQGLIDSFEAGLKSNPKGL